MSEYPDDWEKDPTGKTEYVLALGKGKIQRETGLKKSKFPKIEKRVYDDLCETHNDKYRDDIRLLALEYAKKEKDSKFEATVDWLDDFIERFCLSTKKKGMHAQMKVKVKPRLVRSSKSTSSDGGKKVSEDSENSDNSSDDSKTDKSRKGEDKDKSLEENNGDCITSEKDEENDAKDSENGDDKEVKTPKKGDDKHTKTAEKSDENDMETEEKDLKSPKKSGDRNSKSPKDSNDKGDETMELDDENDVETADKGEDNEEKTPDENSDKDTKTTEDDDESGIKSSEKEEGENDVTNLEKDDVKDSKTPEKDDGKDSKTPEKDDENAKTNSEKSDKNVAKSPEKSDKKDTAETPEIKTSKKDSTKSIQPKIKIKGNRGLKHKLGTNGKDNSKDKKSVNSNGNDVNGDSGNSDDTEKVSDSKTKKDNDENIEKNKTHIDESKNDLVDDIDHTNSNESCISSTPIKGKGANETIDDFFNSTNNDISKLNETCPLSPITFEEEDNSNAKDKGTGKKKKSSGNSNSDDGNSSEDESNQKKKVIEKSRKNEDFSENEKKQKKKKSSGKSTTDDENSSGDEEDKGKRTKKKLKKRSDKRKNSTSVDESSDEEVEKNKSQKPKSKRIKSTNKSSDSEDSKAAQKSDKEDSSDAEKDEDKKKKSPSKQINENNKSIDKNKSKSSTKEQFSDCEIILSSDEEVVIKEKSKQSGQDSSDKKSTNKEKDDISNKVYSSDKNEDKDKKKNFKKEPSAEKEAVEEKPKFFGLKLKSMSDLMYTPDNKKDNKKKETKEKERDKKIQKKEEKLPEKRRGRSNRAKSDSDGEEVHSEPPTDEDEGEEKELSDVKSDKEDSKESEGSEEETTDSDDSSSSSSSCSSSAKEKKEEEKYKKWFESNKTEYSKKENEYYEDHLINIKDKVEEKMNRCTSCNEQVNHLSWKGVYSHPVLGVLMCKHCRKFYGNGDFQQDEEGCDEFCRWCANGGELLLCDSCTNGFCKVCVKRNFGRSGLTKVERAKDFYCYVCNKKPLIEFRAAQRFIIENLVEKHTSAQKKRDKKEKTLKDKFAELQAKRKEKENQAKIKFRHQLAMERVQKTESVVDKDWLIQSIKELKNMLKECEARVQRISYDQRFSKGCKEIRKKSIRRLLRLSSNMKENFKTFEEDMLKKNEGLDVSKAEDDFKTPTKSGKKSQDKKVSTIKKEEKDSSDEESSSKEKGSSSKGKIKVKKMDLEESKNVTSDMSEPGECQNDSLMDVSDDQDKEDESDAEDSSKSKKLKQDSLVKNSEKLKKKSKDKMEKGTVEPARQSSRNADKCLSYKESPSNYKNKNKKKSSVDLDSDYSDSDSDNDSKRKSKKKSKHDSDSDESHKKSKKKKKEVDSDSEDSSKKTKKKKKKDEEDSDSDESSQKSKKKKKDEDSDSEDSSKKSKKKKKKDEDSDSDESSKKYKKKKDDSDDSDHGSSKKSRGYKESDNSGSEDSHQKSKGKDKSKHSDNKDSNKKSKKNKETSDKDSDSDSSKKFNKESIERNDSDEDLFKSYEDVPPAIDSSDIENQKSGSDADKKKNNGVFESAGTTTFRKKTKSDVESSDKENEDTHKNSKSKRKLSTDSSSTSPAKKKSKDGKEEAVSKNNESKKSKKSSKDNSSSKTKEELDENIKAKQLLLGDSDSDSDLDSDDDTKSKKPIQKRKPCPRSKRIVKKPYVKPAPKSVKDAKEKKQLDAKCCVNMKDIPGNIKEELEKNEIIDVKDFPDLYKGKIKKNKNSDESSDDEFEELLKFKINQKKKDKVTANSDDEENQSDDSDSQTEDKAKNPKKPKKPKDEEEEKQKKEGLLDISLDKEGDEEDEEMEEEETSKKKLKKPEGISLNERMKKNLLLSSGEEESDSDDSEAEQKITELSDLQFDKKKQKYLDKKMKEKENENKSDNESDNENKDGDEEEKKEDESDKEEEDVEEEEEVVKKPKSRKGYMSLKFSSSEDEADDDEEEGDNSDFESPRKQRMFIDSASSSSDEDKKPKKSKKRKQESESETSDSDAKEKPKRRRIKRQSSTSDEEDGDKDDKNADSPNKKIRKIIRDEDLTESTKNATQMEQDRRKRIEERQKEYNRIFVEEDKSEDIQPTNLVLDFDLETKEAIVAVDEKLVTFLKPHQFKGIKFMWDATFESVERVQKGEKGGGCILAHCMGLGKTLQTIVFIHTLLTQKKIKKHVSKAMVCCPVSTIYNWVGEFRSWLKGKLLSFEVIELASCKNLWDRAYRLEEWYNEGGVLIIGYDMFRNLSNDQNKKYKGKMKEIFQKSLINPGPDLVVCDEGHILKNEKSAISISINRINSMRRVILTGTPLQNNLKEYHCMIQFVKPNILGTKKEFMNRFVNPIDAGQCVNAPPRDVKRMKRRAHILHNLLEGAVQRYDYTVLKPFLPPKLEYVIAVQLSELQIELYRHYLENLSQGGPKRMGSGLFVDFSNLSRIWSHPKVLELNLRRAEMAGKDEADDLDGFICDDTESSGEESDSNSKKKKAATKKKTKKNDDEEDDENIGDEEKLDDSIALKEKEGSIPGLTENGLVRPDWWKRIIANIASKKDVDEYEFLDVINHSGKLVLLLDVLRECSTIGDKILVFSQSILTLDMIEDFLEMIDKGEIDMPTHDDALPLLYKRWKREYDYLRLDGSVSADVRKTQCKYFNDTKHERCRLFLISTRAGGLGINLVGANRVIIFDSAWNPSLDTQSIFRVYRFGQKKPCYVYRFVAQGTMEEKIYSRQVAKLSTALRVVDEHQIKRYFDMGELSELYEFNPSDPEEREVPIVPEDRLLAEMLIRHKRWIVGYHEHDSLLENQTQEELTEEERKAAWEDFENEKKAGTMMQQNMMRVDPNMAMNMNYGQGGQMNLPTQVPPFNLELIRNNIVQQNPNFTPNEIDESLVMATKQIQKIHLNHYQRLQSIVYNLNNPMISPEVRRMLPFGNHPEMVPMLKSQLKSLEGDIQKENEVISKFSQNYYNPQAMNSVAPSGSNVSQFVNRHKKTLPLQNKPIIRPKPINKDSSSNADAEVVTLE